MQLRPLVRRLLSLRPRTIRRGIGKGLRIDLRHASGWYARGTNEVPIQNELARHLKAGQTFFDVGANVGFFSLLAARLVGPKGQVIAFEPVPANAASIRRNARLNKFTQIRVIEAAVGETPGAIELILTRHPGGATIIQDTPSPDITGRARVPMVQLDDLIQRRELPLPDVIKIDVEGAEPAVIRGLESTAHAHHPTLICELDDSTVEGVERKVAEVESLLRSWGYKTVQLERAYAKDGWPVRHILATSA